MFRGLQMLYGTMKISKLCKQIILKNSILNGKLALTPIFKEIGRELYSI